MKRRNKLKYIILIFTLVFTSVSTSNISFSEELKLCGIDWPPFTYSEKNRIIKGISFDVYTEAFRRLNVHFTAREIPWPRCLKYVEEGKYDAVIDNGASASFLNGMFPTGFYPLAMYVRNNFPQNTFSWKDMKGKSVGMVRGYDYTEKIINFEGWVPRFSNTDELLIKKLHEKRYDYVILDIFSAPILSERLGKKIKMLTPLIDSTNLYLVFNKNNAEIAKEYDKVIGKMIQDGTIDSIYLKYLSKSYTEIMNMSTN